MQIQSTIRPHPIQAVKPPVAEKQTEESPDKLSDRVSNLMGGVGAGAAASLVGAAYPTTWLHEMGHAKVAEMMYQGANPSVEVWPFKGGVTRWTPGPLTELGQKFGEDGARAAVSAAGTIVDLGVAATSFGIGFKLRKKHPIVGTAMMGFGAMNVLNSISYAATAVGKDLGALARQGNDFASIAVRTGLPPIASIALMAAMLPLEYAALSYLERMDIQCPETNLVHFPSPEAEISSNRPAIPQKFPLQEKKNAPRLSPEAERPHALERHC